jgi:hypothetical protein
MKIFTSSYSYKKIIYGKIKYNNLSEIFTFPLLRHIENVINSLIMKLTCIAGRGDVATLFWFHYLVTHRA